MEKAIQDIELIKNYIRRNSRENSIPGSLFILFGILPLIFYYSIKYFLLDYIKQYPILSITIGCILFLLFITCEYFFIFYGKDQNFTISKKRLKISYVSADTLFGISMIATSYILYRLGAINHIGPANLFMLGFFILILSFYIDKNFIFLAFSLFITSPVIFFLFEQTLLPSLFAWTILIILFVLLKKNNILCSSIKIIKDDDINLELLLHSRSIKAPSSIFLIWGLVIFVSYILFSERFFIITGMERIILIILLLITGFMGEMLFFLNQMKKEKLSISKGITFYLNLMGFSLGVFVIFTILVFSKLNGFLYIIPYISLILSSVFIIFSLSFFTNFTIYAVILFIISCISFFFLNIAADINAISYSVIYILFYFMTYKKERIELNEKA